MIPGFVCKHLPQLPVLCVMNDPVDDNDSGLVLLCSSERHGDEDLKILNLDRHLDPALRELISTLSAGQIAIRSTPGQPWVIEYLPPEEAPAVA